MSDQSCTKLAFLDTNSLVELFTFWEGCTIAQLPMSSVNKWQDLQGNLSTPPSYASAVLSKADFSHIQNGLSCYRKMDAAKTRYDYLCCLVSRSELQHTILAAYAAEELRRHRVPWTLANKRPLRVYQRVLSDQDYSHIAAQIDSFFETLSYDHSIDIKSVEQIGHGYHTPQEDVFHAAETIWSHVLMETMDAYILAAAIECQADYLLTADETFRSTVNNLQNPQGEWQAVSQSLSTALRKSEHFSFPIGISPHSTTPLA